MSQRTRKDLTKLDRETIIEQLHNALSHILEEPSTAITPELRKAGVDACHESNRLEAAIVNQMAREGKNPRQSWNSLARRCGWDGTDTAFGYLSKKLDALLAADEEPATMPYPREQYVKHAKETYESDDLEIDDNAKVSRVDGGDDGCWVSSWVWVPDADLVPDAVFTPEERTTKINAIVADRIENFDLRDYLKSFEPELRSELSALTDEELKQRYEELFPDEAE